MVKNKFKKIIISLILIGLLIPCGKIFAVEPVGGLTPAQAGQILAQYAENFCMTYGANSSSNQTIYDWSDNRNHGYRLEKFSGTAEGYYEPYPSYTDKYPMDCVGFVSAMIHQALGIGGENFTEFITPQTGVYDDLDVPGTGNEYFKETSENPQPGDILHRLYKPDGSYGPHVMIYLGPDGSKHRIAHSTYYSDVDRRYLGAIVESKEQSYINQFSVYRFNPDVTSLIDPTKTASTPGTMISTAATINIEETEFYYNGVPDGRYSVADSFWMILIDALKDIFTFLVNILFFIFRMVFVGFTAIFELLLTFIIESVAGESNLKIDTTTTESSGAITIEGIIFNRVNIFDVNFFKSTP